MRRPYSLTKRLLRPITSYSPSGVAARDVAGAQRVDRLAERQVGRAVRVAHHHVGSAVDQFADVGSGHPSSGSSVNEPPGIGRPIEAGCDCGEFRWQVGHSGGRLGGAVHDEQLPARCAAPSCGEAAHAVGWQPAAGLGDVAQIGQVDAVEADPLEQLEGVGHAGERRCRGAGGTASQNSSSTTERSVRMSPAPRSRWLWITERP